MRSSDVPVPRRARVSAIGVVVALLAGVLTVAGAPVVAPAGAAIIRQLDVAPSGQECLSGVLHASTSFPGCNGIDITQRTLVNGSNVAQGTPLQVGDVVEVSVVVSVGGVNELKPFYTETGDGLINTEDWEARLRITVPTQAGVLSPPTISAYNRDHGSRGVGDLGQCAAQSGTEPAREDDLNLVLGAAPVGRTGLKADRSGDVVTVRWTDLAVDRCAESVSQNGIYPGQGFYLTQTVLARPTSDQTLTWGTSGLSLGFKNRPAVDRLTWGANRDLSLSIKGLPTAPTGVTATPQNGSARVSWTTPSTNGGSPLAGYVVTPYIGTDAQDPQTFNGGATTRTVTGLTNQTTYTFRVAAFTNVGTGAQSAPSNAVTPSAAPGAPTAVTAQPRNGSALVSWTNPTDTGGAALTRARVSVYRNGAFAGEQNPPAGATSTTVSGLTNGASYTFTVAVGNAVAFGPASTPSAAVVPGPTPAPPNLSVQTSSELLLVEWTVADDGGSPVTRAEVVLRDADGQIVETATVPASRTYTFFSGLPNGTSYRVSVALRNARGLGDPAVSGLVTVGVGPAAPTITGASAAFSPNSVFVSWNDPADVGTNPITGGRLRAFSGGVEVANQPYDGDLTNGQITGLTAGTAYTFTVQVCNVVACGPQSSASAPVTAIGLPSAPTIVGTERTANGVDVSWTPGADTGGRPVTGYRITPYVDGVADIPTFTTDQGTASVDFLTLGTVYTFTVAADNGFFYSEESTPSAPVMAGPASLPNAPAIGTATGNADGTVTVRWSPPTDDGTGAIRGYILTPYLGGVAQDIDYALSSETERTIPVHSGIAYQFTVAAVNEAGLGPASALSNSVVARAPAGTPGAPTGVAAALRSEAAFLSWTAPASTGSGPITGYAVTPYVGGVAGATRTLTGAATSATITGLVNGTSYRFRVEALNAAGTGPISSPSNPVIPSLPPSAPTIQRATPGIGSVTLTWTPPADTGGTAITGYRITPYVDGVGQTPTDLTGNVRTGTVSGLLAGLRYTFTVTAVNAAGPGAASDHSRATAPTAAAGTPGAPTIGAVTAGDASATVRWTAPATTGSGPVTGYRITAFAAGPVPPPVVVGAGATSVVVTGLTNGIAHTFRVAAINGAGAGVVSAASREVMPLAPAAPPAAPTITSVTAGNGQVTVFWSTPSSGGAPITSYRVTPYLGDTPQAPVSFPGTNSGGVVLDLTNGSAYRFAVAAINRGGAGPKSARSAPVTPTAPPGTASAPAIGTAEAFNTTAVVRWSAPASDGGSAVTGYQVTPFVAGVAGTPVTFAGTGTVQVVTGLDNGTTYVFRVSAVNANGIGSPSTGSNPVTPNPAPGTPPAPTIVSATSGSGGVTLTWNPPTSNGDSPITGYRVTPFVGGVAQPPFQYNDTLTTHTIAPLTSGTTYTFKVAAVNGNGPGADSAMSDAVTAG